MGGYQIEPTKIEKSLGFYFDSNMSMSAQITEVTKKCYSNLHNLWKISSKLHKPIKIQLVNSLILSHLDYCNAVYYGLPDYLINELQKIQNAAIRFIFNLYGRKRREHITPYLKKLHILPIKFRIMFKIALICFKCINNIAPTYLSSLIQMKSYTNYHLRVDDDYFLLEKHSQPKHVSTRNAFLHSAPLVWNEIPYDIRSIANVEKFKKLLKTYYFNCAFATVE